MDVVKGKIRQIDKNVSDASLTTVKLPSVLAHFNAPKVIDFLSLDVEGAELLTMRGMEGSWDEYIFLTILIERPQKDLHKLLVTHGYWFYMVLNSWGDVLYLHPSAPGFEERVMLKPRTIHYTFFERKAHKFLLLNASMVHSKQTRSGWGLTP
jgi:hypothetical protein